MNQPRSRAGSEPAERGEFPWEVCASPRPVPPRALGSTLAAQAQRRAHLLWEGGAGGGRAGQGPGVIAVSAQGREKRRRSGRRARRTTGRQRAPLAAMFKKLKQKISEEQTPPRGAGGRAAPNQHQVAQGPPGGGGLGLGLELGFVVLLSARHIPQSLQLPSFGGRLSLGLAPCVFLKVEKLRKNFVLTFTFRFFSLAIILLAFFFLIFF